MILLSLYGFYLSIRNKIVQAWPWLKWSFLWGIALPHIANTAGWIMTEIGRQPWTVFGYMRTEDSLSPGVTAGEVLFSLISFSSVYLILTGVMVYLFVRVIQKGPYSVPKANQVILDPYDRGEEHAVS